jgi:hypothetical protein
MEGLIRVVRQVMMPSTGFQRAIELEGVIHPEHSLHLPISYCSSTISSG